MQIFYNKLGFSTTRGFLEKVDIAKKADTTDFTNSRWAYFSDSYSEIEENTAYLVKFSYNNRTYQTIFFTGYVRTQNQIYPLTTVSDGTDYIDLYCSYIDGIRKLDGTINGDYSLWDNISEMQVLKIR